MKEQSSTYHPARLSYVAWDIAPHVPVTDIQESGDCTLLTLECGHVLKCANHFTYTLGSRQRCGECGEARALTLPEFKGATPDTESR